MQDEELQVLVKSISLESFGREFKHKATFNNRLRTTGGRYHLESHHLDFNPKIPKHFSIEILEGIIKHELCHYHLHLEKKGYRHRDPDFKRLLKKVNGLRYSPSIELKKGRLVRWVYRCSHCQGKIYRKRRFDLDRYRCGKCMGRLTLEGQEEMNLEGRKL